MIRRIFCLMSFTLLTCLVFSFPVLAQERTTEEITETTDRQSIEETTTGLESRQGQQEDETAVQQQYDDAEENDADAANSSASNDDDLTEVCPSAREVATLSADGDSPEFDLRGDFLLVRTVYNNDDGNGLGVNITLYKENGNLIDFAETGEESGTYDARFNEQPGRYFVEATEFGGTFESTIYDCGSSANNGGDNDSGENSSGIPDEVIPESIPDKTLANTGGAGFMLPFSVLMIGMGLLGFAALKVRR